MGDGCGGSLDPFYCECNYGKKGTKDEPSTFGSHSLQCMFPYLSFVDLLDVVRDILTMTHVFYRCFCSPCLGVVADIAHALSSSVIFKG